MYRAARAFAQEGLYDEAIRILDLAIELKESGDLSDLYVARGEILMMAGDSEEAEKSLNIALEKNSLNPDVLELLRHIRD